MKPSILKVFSTYPTDHCKLTDVKKNHMNSIVKISHLDVGNDYQRKSDYSCNDSSDEFYNSKTLYNYDNIQNEETGKELNQDSNVWNDFSKFQKYHNSKVDNKKFCGNNARIQQKLTYERPNFSYTQLIYMAIESTLEKALTVSDIYFWCEQNFPYYANAINGWKNSLRHNLSINKCFKKITKLGIGGRGSLWVIDPRERHHLVSTMNRSNVSSFNTSSIFQTKPFSINHAITEDLLTHLNENFDENDVVEIVEKPPQEWTDTRLNYYHESPDCQSVTSDTDYNDWERSVTSLQPMFPVKTHWYNECLGTPSHLPDHNYCVPEVDVLLNNPSLMIRHSFFSSTDQIETFSTSSDFNDEDWPQTPSPISLQPVDFHMNFAESVLPFSPTSVDESQKPVGRKRGRPCKEGGQSKLSKEDTHITPKYQLNNGHTDRINNLYDLNTFFNSL